MREVHLGDGERPAGQVDAARLGVERVVRDVGVTVSLEEPRRLPVHLTGAPDAKQQVGVSDHADIGEPEMTKLWNHTLYNNIRRIDVLDRNSSSIDVIEILFLGKLVI
jgi:hypothetical protein